MLQAFGFRNVFPPLRGKLSDSGHCADRRIAPAISFAHVPVKKLRVLNLLSIGVHEEFVGGSLQSSFISSDDCFSVWADDFS